MSEFFLLAFLVRHLEDIAELAFRSETLGFKSTQPWTEEESTWGPALHHALFQRLVVQRPQLVIACSLQRGWCGFCCWLCSCHWPRGGVEMWAKCVKELQWPRKQGGDRAPYPQTSTAPTGPGAQWLSALWGHAGCLWAFRMTGSGWLVYLR